MGTRKIMENLSSTSKMKGKNGAESKGDKQRINMIKEGEIDLKGR